MKKQITLYLFLLSAFCLINAHEKIYTKKHDSPTTVLLKTSETINTRDTTSNAVSYSPSNDEILEICEKMPEFPGGNTALMEFIKNNIRYPANAKNMSIQSMVIVKFIVGTDGSLSDFQIIKSIDPELDEEALRVVKLMPNWIPGEHAGKKVKVYFKLPIRFRLNQ